MNLEPITEDDFRRESGGGSPPAFYFGDGLWVHGMPPKQGELNFDGVTFSALVGEARKQEGMELAANSKEGLLEQVREALIQIALQRPSREVTADDAQAWLIEHGRMPTDLGNAAGSMFPRHEWEFTGRWTNSARVSRHRNAIRIWRLK